MKPLFLLIALLYSMTFSYAQTTNNIIYLWPDEVPLAKDEKHPPVQTSDTSRGVIRLTDVTNPAILVYEPAPELRNGAAIIIAPGGGYQILAENIEGVEIAEWLNRLGFTAFVLQYRVPAQEEAALLDMQRALDIVNKRKEQWNLEAGKIGVMGFSAGGSLAARATPKGSEKITLGPDFAILIYPAYLSRGENNTITPDLNINSKTPPSFIFSTSDDPWSNISALTYARALQEADKSYEFHILPKGGHGYGLRPGNIAAETWPVLAEKWLRENVLK